MWNKPWLPLPYLHLEVNTEYLAADDVGGRFSGCTKRVLVATLWWKRCNLNLSSVSPKAFVYRHSSAASPALDNVSDCSILLQEDFSLRYEVVVRTNVFKSDRVLFPWWIPEKLYHSRGWHEQTTVLQTARPSTLCTYLMFQHRGLFFVPDLISGLKKTSQESSLTWKHIYIEAQADPCHRQPR